ncbi:MAG TPA: FeoB-associated Cys-rich membrane protein [Candidatus Blautia faecipullorum]|nr:FeoB-associated Cys-rich membrane protein [Candidatus Blautia faecipullorum]
MGTVIVLAVLVLIVGLIVRSMIRDKKNGKSLQCGGNCSGCGGHCHCSAGDGSSGRS